MLILGTTGISISQHYCHGKLVSSSFYSKAKTCSGSDCPACQDKTFAKRINDNFVSSHFVTDPVKHVQLFTIYNPVIAINFVGNFLLTSYNISYQKAPPPGLNSETQEFLEVFRC